MTFLRSPKEIFYNPSTGLPLTNGAVRLSTLSSEGLPTDTRISRVYSLDGTALDNEDGIFPLGADGGGYFDIRVSARVELLAVGYADAADPIAVAAFDHIIISESTGSDTSSQVTPSDTLNVFGAVAQAGATPSSIGHKSIEDVYYTASRGFRPLLSYDETKARIQDANLPITAYEDIRVSNTDGGISALYRFRPGNIVIAGFASTDAQPPATRFLNVEPGVSEGWADHWTRLDLVAPASVATAKIADDAVTTAKIPDGAITTAKIPDDAITTAKIPDEAITTAKIPDEAITTAKIADGAVTVDKIIGGVIDTAQLANAAVTGQKINYGSFISGFRASVYSRRFRGKNSSSGNPQPVHTWTVPNGELWKVLVYSPAGRPANADGDGFREINPSQSNTSLLINVGLFLPGVTINSVSTSNFMLMYTKAVSLSSFTVNTSLSNYYWGPSHCHYESSAESAGSNYIALSGLLYNFNSNDAVRVNTPFENDVITIIQLS